MNDQPTRSYFAVISANVRYCKALTANAKLLYAEITALSNEKGFCYATNKYFSELYNVDTRTVQRWLAQLENLGYIFIEIIYFEGTKQVKSRYISLNAIVRKKQETQCDPHDKIATTPHDKNVVTPHDKIATTSSLNNNIYINNKRKLLKENLKTAVEYLNKKANTQYSPTSQATLIQLEKLFDEGYTLDDVKKVIDNKVKEWLGSSFERYLRPQTLFGKNFDNYLNDKPYTVISAKREQLMEHDYSCEQLNSVMTSIEDLDIL